MTTVIRDPLGGRYSTTYRTYEGKSYKTLCACRNPGEEREVCKRSHWHEPVGDEFVHVARVCECACHGPRRWDSAQGKYVDGASTASEAYDKAPAGAQSEA